MPKLSLLYFAIPGRAGPIRDALRIGGVAFEDVHVAREDFKRMKTAGELPYGSLPALDVHAEGDVPRRIAQSNAILRYVGRLAKLYPDDAIEALRVDELLDFAEDMNHALSPSMREPDMEKKLAMRKLLVEETIPHWCRSFEARLDANDDPRHLVGAALTVADLKLVHAFDSLVSGVLDGVPKTALDGYTKLGTWRDAVHAERAAALGGPS